MTRPPLAVSAPRGEGPEHALDSFYHPFAYAA
jgi:hypothetical protein